MPLPAPLARACTTGALCVLALAFGVNPAWGDDAVSLRATAGLGGFVKSGRWAPVFVEIDHRDDAREFSADLIVSWGDATVRRRVFIDSTGTRRFEVYVRTNEAGSVIRVRLEPAGPALDVPVTVMPFDARVSLCVGASDSAFGDTSRCLVTITPPHLPASARAYEIADEVHTFDEAHRLKVEHRVAIDLWRSIHSLETSGDLSLTPQATRPVVRRGLPGASAALITAVGGAYLSLLVFVGFVVANRRVALTAVAVGFAAILATASAMTLWVGHIGPASQVTVHHTSLLQQLPGIESALVSVRAVAESPANGEMQLSVPLSEAMIEASMPAGRAEQLVDEYGHASLRVRAGLGTRHAFAVEGIASAHWLAVTDDGRTVRITNRTDTPLDSCRFADGMSPTQVGTLPAGGVATAERHSEVMGPLFMCTSTAPVVALRALARVVDMVGRTTVAVYQPRAPATAEAPND